MKKKFDGMMTQNKACRRLGITKETMLRWRKKGKCPDAVVCGLTGKVRIPEAWVKQMEDKQNVEI